MRLPHCYLVLLLGCGSPFTASEAATDLQDAAPDAGAVQDAAPRATDAAKDAPSVDAHADAPAATDAGAPANDAGAMADAAPSDDAGPGAAAPDAAPEAGPPTVYTASCAPASVNGCTFGPLGGQLVYCVTDGGALQNECDQTHGYTLQDCGSRILDGGLAGYFCCPAPSWPVGPCQ